MEIEEGSVGNINGEIYSMSSKPFKASTTIDDFSLLSVLGKGSYAKVVLVRKKDNQKVYALKILKKTNVQKKMQQSKVIDEKQILVNTSLFLRQNLTVWLIRSRLTIHLSSSSITPSKTRESFTSRLSFALEVSFSVCYQRESVSQKNSNKSVECV